MLKRNVSINEIVGEARDVLCRHIKVDSLILFGSYAYGTPHEHSDIDLAVVSEDFERMGAFEKIRLFARVAGTVDSRLEIIGFPRNVYQTPPRASFLEMIKRRGKLLNF